MNEETSHILVQPHRIVFKVRGDTIHVVNGRGRIAVETPVRRFEISGSAIRLQIVHRRYVFKVLEGPPGASGIREVYSETPDPVVAAPSINFVPGEWADPDIYEMKVFIP